MTRSGSSSLPRANARARRFRPERRGPWGARRLRLELLEDRIAPANVNWTAVGGGDWDTAANWTDNLGAHRVPGSGDDVTIGTLAGATITHTQNVTDTIHSLTSGTAITLSNGTLNVTTTLQSSATFTLAGGTLAAATVQSGTTLTEGSGTVSTLNGVTLDGNLNLTGYNAGINVNAGLTLNGLATLKAAAYLNFLGSNQTLAGTGTVLFGDGDNRNALLSTDGHTLTIGSGILVHGNGGVVGYSGYWQGSTAVAVVNQGTIAADGGGTVYVGGGTASGITAWSNAGTLQAVSGSGLSLSGTGGANTATGQINAVASITGSASTLSLANTWANAGTITATSSTVNLGGTFTLAQLGTFNRTGGTVNLTGTLTNTGTTLALTAATGNWVLAGGTITGGTVSVAGGSRLIVTSSDYNNTLAGVTLLDPSNASQPVLALDMTGYNAGVTITGNLTLSNTQVDLRAAAYLNFLGANQSLTGSGAVLFADGDTRNGLLSSDGHTLTIGSGILVHGNGGVVGYSGYWQGSTAVTVVNQGTISADAGGSVYVGGGSANAWLNQGTLTAANGGTLLPNGIGGSNPTGQAITANGGSVNLSGSWANAGPISETGGTLSLSGSWVNTGAITSTNATTNLGGTFTLATLGSFTRSGGTVNLDGTLTNTGTTLALTAATGSWTLAGGTIQGGTVSVAGGADLLVSSSDYNNTLAGVTLLDPSNASQPVLALDMTGYNAGVTITGNLTLSNTQVDLRAAAYLNFLGANQSLTGSGAVLFADGDTRNGLLSSDGHTLTIGSGILVHGNGGVVGYSGYWQGSTAVTVVNQGTISADAGGSVYVGGGSANAWLNQGTLTAANGGTLLPNGTGGSNPTGQAITANGGSVNLSGSWANAGPISETGGTLSLSGSWVNTGAITSTNATTNLGGTFTLAQLGSFTRSGGTVNLDGTLTNTGTTLALTAATGNWVLAGGTITGGTVSVAGGSRLIVTSSDYNNTLAGVTLLDPSNASQPVLALDMTGYNAGVTITGNLTLSNTQVDLRAAAYLNFLGANQSLTGSGAVLFADGDTRNGLLSSDGHTLTIGSGILVHGNGGVVGYSGYWQGSTAVTVVNQGTISADAGGSVYVGGGSANAWLNQGTLTAANGGTLLPNGTGGSNPTGQAITANGGSVNLSGSWANAGPISETGGTLSLSGSWVNTGAITSTNATTNLGGTFTLAQLGSFTRSGGTVNLDGTLTNTGTTLALTAATGNWVLAGGTITGGTVSVAGGSRLIVTSSDYNNTLAGVTLLDPSNASQPVLALDMTGYNAGVTINGGLTLSNAQIDLRAAAYLNFLGSNQTLGGSGTVLFADGDTRNGLFSTDGHTLTIGPNVLVHGNGGVVGYSGYWQGSTAVAVVNQGTIAADAGGTVYVGGGTTSPAWTNQGSFQAANSGTLSLSGTGGSNAAAGQISLNGGTLTLANTWTNAGTITSTNSTVNLGGGPFTLAQLGSFTRSGGTVNLTGTLVNTGTTLQLDANSGNWVLLGGTITGGTVLGLSGSKLVGTTSGGVLNGVTLQGDPSQNQPLVFDLNGYSTYAGITGDLTLTNAAVNLTGGARLDFNSTPATLAGTGAVYFANDDSRNNLRPTSNAGQLTIAAGITVHGFGGTVGYSSYWGGPSNVVVINQGTIGPDSPGTTYITGASASNQGTFQAGGGGTLYVEPTTVTNFSGGTLTGGNWQVHAGSTLRVILSTPITTNAASILLDGSGSNFYRDTATTDALAGLTTNAAGGSLTVQNGRTYTPGAFTNAGNVTVGGGSTLGLGGTYTQTGGTTQLQAGTLPVQHPPVGNALTFNGTSDYVTIPDAASLRPTNLTLEGWVNFSQYPSGVLSLFGRALGSSFLDSYAVWINGGALYGGIADTSGQSQISVGWSPTLNTWYHVAFTFDDPSNTMVLYINGNVVATGTTASSIVYDNHPLLLGADIDSGPIRYFLPGSLDDFRLYNVARTQAQIQSDMSQTLTGSEANLAAYLPLDEGSGITAYDLTANGNNGTLGGGVPANEPTWTAVTLAGLTGPNAALGSPNPTIGAALSFNGSNNYVQLPATGFSNFSNGLTFEVWAYPTSVASYQRFFDFGNGAGSDNLLLARSGTSNDLVFQSYNGTTAGALIYAPNAIQLNTWQHFAVVLQPSGLVTLYKNGVAIGEGYSAVPRNVNRTLNYLGHSNWSSDGYYGGRLDDVRVYNRALSATEIAASLNSTLTGSETGLLAYYPMDEGSGTVINDRTANHLNGTVNGASWVSVTHAAVSLQGGTLSGTGTVNADLTNAATLSPGGTGAGALLVNGNYTQTAAGSLNIDLGGLTAGSLFDQLNVNGTATLGGILNVDEINGFTPANGNTFPVVTDTSLSGQFGATNGLTSSQVTLVPNYAPAGFTLVSERPGIEVTPTTGLQTSQAGGTATFSVYLDSQPAANVTIGLSSSNTSAGIVSVSQLVFTPANWNVPQTVTITGVNDNIAHGNVAYTIVTAPAVSADPLYNGFDPSDVNVTNLGTVFAGFAVTPTTGLQTSQAGGTATFTVALTSLPQANVSFSLTSSNTSAGTVSPASLTFTPANWNVPQTVTVTGANDQRVDGNIAYTINATAAVSGDPAYSQLTPPSVSVTNLGTNLLDLQVVNLAVTPATGLQSGNTVTINWNDTVTGNIPTPAGFYDNVTVVNQTTSQTLVNQQVYYDPTQNGNGAIQPGQQRARSYQFTLPNGTAGVGQLQVTVTTNSTVAFQEANTAGTASTNNSATLTTTSTLAPYPDLQVTNLAVQPASGVQSGTTLMVSWSDANTGNGAVNASFDDNVTVKNLTTNQVLTSTNLLYNAAASGPIAAAPPRTSSSPTRCRTARPASARFR